MQKGAEFHPQYHKQKKRKSYMHVRMENLTDTCDGSGAMFFLGPTHPVSQSTPFPAPSLRSTDDPPGLPVRLSVKPPCYLPAHVSCHETVSILKVRIILKYIQISVETASDFERK